MVFIPNCTIVNLQMKTVNNNIPYIQKTTVKNNSGFLCMPINVDQFVFLDLKSFLRRLILWMFLNFIKGKM